MTRTLTSVKPLKYKAHLNKIIENNSSIILRIIRNSQIHSVPLQRKKKKPQKDLLEVKVRDMYKLPL